MTDLTFSTHRHRTRFRSNISHPPSKYFQPSRVQEDFRIYISLTNFSLLKHERRRTRELIKGKKGFFEETPLPDCSICQGHVTLSLKFT